MNTIKIKNRGRHIEASNYYETDYAHEGVVVVSVNDRAFRLLIPPRIRDGSTDAETVKEMTQKVKYVIASRGIAQGSKVVTFIFEDGSQSPYMLTSDYGAFVGFGPAESDHGRTDLTCLGYVQSRAGGIREAFDLKCKLRWSEGSPDLSPWGAK